MNSTQDARPATGEPQPVFMYGHLSTFLGVPRLADLDASKADLVVQGIPFDLGTQGRPGTRYGPTAIRTTSVHLAWEETRWPWEFKLFDELTVEDAGDVAFTTGMPERMVDEVMRRTGSILAAGKRVMSFGGDHYVALPLLRAHHEHHGTLSLLHFDAHTDTDPGEDYDHGTMFHHAVKEGLIDPSRSVQVGIRTDYERKDYPFTVLDADWVVNHGPRKTAERIKEVLGGHAVYMSFDIDCLDPSCAPGTGTPVVGGPSTNAVLQTVRDLIDLDIVGLDLVEVSPPYDTADITALAGASICLEFLYVLAERKRQGLLR